MRPICRYCGWEKGGGQQGEGEMDDLMRVEGMAGSGEEDRVVKKKKVFLTLYRIKFVFF